MRAGRARRGGRSEKLSGPMETLSIRAARRLALARAGLLDPRAHRACPGRSGPRSRRRFAAAQAVIRRFGYLQLDTVSVAGARSHTIVLLSRLEGLDATVGEELLRPGAPIFEYWGHEASWIPLSLYPAFEFRRREFRSHPWWGDLVREHPQGRARPPPPHSRRRTAPLRRTWREGRTGKGWWDLGVMKRVASSLWSSGELAIRERRNFQRTYDLAERVIPEDAAPASPARPRRDWRRSCWRALDGHGWATTGTLAATWRPQEPQGGAGGDAAAAAGEGTGRRLRPGEAAMVARDGLDPSRRTRSWRRGWSARAAARGHGRAALALRSGALGPGAGGPPLRLRCAARDLQARAPACVRLLLPAGAGGRDARRTRGSQGRPEERAAARGVGPLREDGPGDRPAGPARPRGSRFGATRTHSACGSGRSPWPGLHFSPARPPDARGWRCGHEPHRGSLRGRPAAQGLRERFPAGQGSLPSRRRRATRRDQAGRDPCGRAEGALLRQDVRRRSRPSGRGGLGSGQGRTGPPHPRGVQRRGDPRGLDPGLRSFAARLLRGAGGPRVEQRTVLRGAPRRPARSRSSKPARGLAREARPLSGRAGPGVSKAWPRAGSMETALPRHGAVRRIVRDRDRARRTGRGRRGVQRDAASRREREAPAARGAIRRATTSTRPSPRRSKRPGSAR